LFTITRNGSGFHIKFKNNILLSVQFGWGTYSDNNDVYTDKDCLKDEFGRLCSLNCEVAIWREIGEEHRWITNKMMKDLYPDKYPDDTLGYVTSDELVKIINWCAKRRKIKGEKNE